MQPGFLIEVLPWKAQVEGELHFVPVRVFIGCRCAEGVGVPAPDDFACRVVDQARGAEVVGVDVIVRRRREDHRRQAVEPDEFLDHRATAVVFAQQQTVVVVNVIGRGAARDLAYPLAEGVVAVGGLGGGALFHRGEAAPGVVGKGQRTVCGDVAGGVVGIGVGQSLNV